MAQKVTMQQIADYLGVSKFVVSRALSGKSGVSHATKERVFQAASQLGYFAQKNKNVNFNKVLHHHETVELEKKKTVLVLMPNIRYQTKDSSYWGRIVDGISDELERLGFGLVISTENNAKSISTILNPTGFLGIVGVGFVSSSLLLDVHRLGLPMILVDHEDPLIPTDSIFNNNFDCSQSLTNYLIGLGHKHIKFVGDNSFSRSFYDRWLGYRSALELSGLYTGNKEEIISVNATGNNGVMVEMKNWIQRKQRNKTTDLPTAFVCANDSIALNVMAALNELEIKVPEQISVAGFDNINESFQMSPTLTTVNVPKEQLGKRAVEMLMKRQKEKEMPFEKVLVAGVIMHRETCAPVSKTKI